MTIIRRPRAAEPSELEDFDETISSDLETTQRGLRKLDPRHVHTPEYLTFQQQVIHAQTEEIRILRAELAKVVTALNFKASKKALQQTGIDLSARLDQRIDAIRNWTVVLLTALGLIFAAVKLMSK